MSKDLITVKQKITSSDEEFNNFYPFFIEKIKHLFTKIKINNFLFIHYKNNNVYK